jgi:hypothetical protein
MFKKQLAIGQSKWFLPTIKKKRCILQVILLTMVHGTWFKKDNFRFHKSSFAQNSIVDSQVKKNGKIFFLVFFSST